MFKRSALDLWKEEEGRTSIVTFCKDLDLALGSGISAGVITEICGPPGSGKTQLCLQLLINVQIPRQLGGVEGCAVYLDTNYGFSPQRVREMAHACQIHCRNLALFRKLNPTDVLSGFTQDTALDGIMYSHVSSYSEIIEAIAVLQNKLYDHEKIKLIVIDSLSFLIRNTTSSSLKRVKHLHEILTLLHKLANRFGCAVIVTNDVTTRISDNETSERRMEDPRIVPALGESHSHKINQRILLGRDETCSNLHNLEQISYVASIEKGHFPPVTIPFRIESVGIRSIKQKVSI
ncbi:DNA repair protein RAD51 homolog 3 [Anopheles nili]|uniref:DNA repair protein RAD51 homolog 3 n=1 Tax=Anopheles nili TaxID=185578 RepID=UPI00237BA227|nr:DNA repair protein RAD51 homolog 3 [Anopheles nili]